jgi:hypothetical protein
LLFVGFGFSDDQRLVLPFLLFVFFVLVFIIVGTSRRCRVARDGGMSSMRLAQFRSKRL